MPTTEHSVCPTCGDELRMLVDEPYKGYCRGCGYHGYRTVPTEERFDLLESRVAELEALLNAKAQG